MEDTTTLFVWWRTGTFDRNSSFSVANLITTAASAILTLSVTVVSAVRYLQLHGLPDHCCPGADVMVVVMNPIVMTLMLAFWFYLGMGLIRKGEWDGSKRSDDAVDWSRYDDCVLAAYVFSMLLAFMRTGMINRAINGKIDLMAPKKRGPVMIILTLAANEVTIEV